MKNFTFILLLVFSFTLPNSTFAATPIACSQQYALCTSAQCIPDPLNANAATCNCITHNGSSLGYTTCATRKPYTDKNKITHLTSTFSLENFPRKQGMQCDSGMPWTNCLDQPCTVNPLNPNQAICSCPIIRQGTFITFGGDCNKATCSTGFWSAALESQAMELLANLKKTRLPQLNNAELMCPLENK